jgi:hypothetical protein
MRPQLYFFVMSASNLKIALLFLFFILILKLLLLGWQKISLIRTGKNFKFLLTHFSFKKEVSWQDVKYSIFVVVDALVSILILLWIYEKLF